LAARSDGRGGARAIKPRAPDPPASRPVHRRVNLRVGFGLVAPIPGTMAAPQIPGTAELTGRIVIEAGPPPGLCHYNRSWTRVAVEWSAIPAVILARKRPRIGTNTT
jgi:hypothetical protein